MKFVLKNTSRGWEIECCKPLREGSKNWQTARLQWRSMPESLNEEFIHDTYEEAKEECDSKNGITKRG